MGAPRDSSTLSGLETATAAPRRTFCVDRNPQPDGTHHVHELGPGSAACAPPWESQLFLGIRAFPEDALLAARDTYLRAIGCAHCLAPHLTG